MIVRQFEYKGWDFNKEEPKPFLFQTILSKIYVTPEGMLITYKLPIMSEVERFHYLMDNDIGGYRTRFKKECEDLRLRSIPQRG